MTNTYQEEIHAQEYTVDHKKIFPGRQWSMFYGNILISTIWLSKTNENGRNVSTLATKKGAQKNNKYTAHINRIKRAINDGSAIYGAIINEKKKISDKHYYKCTPISIPLDSTEENLDQPINFKIIKKKGDIRNIIKESKKNQSPRTSNTPKLPQIIKYAEQYLPQREFVHQHTILQRKLIDSLSQKSWPFNDDGIPFKEIVPEKLLPSGKRCDVAKLDQHGKIIEIYEIKPYKTATIVIRAAIGQLIQYHFLLEKNKDKLKKLVAVGPAKLRKQEQDFLNHICEIFKKSFGIEFEYMYIPYRPSR